MTAVAAYVVLVVVIPTLGLGHQGQHWPLAGVWRAVRARRARAGRCTPARAPQSPFRLPRSLRDVPSPAQSRTVRPEPSWAHTQPLNPGNYL